jgi:protein-disulfide isomerase
MLPAGQAAPSEEIPVGPDDPQRGDALALVTIVQFADFQCPFCARVVPTIDRLAESYGPDRVRVVWKHLPLAFHPFARPTAELGAAVHALGGHDAFWRFHRKAFETGGKLDDDRVAILAQETGYDSKKLGDTIAHRGSAKVDADLALAEALGVRGTPGFMINGVFLSGAQPYEKFAEIVDAEIAQAKTALAAGVPRERLYAARVAKNRADAPPPHKPRPEPPDEPDTTVWSVPLDGSPVRGRPDALVTLVAFTDFQCPFCAKANGVVLDLQKRYGAELRIVHKNRPLPFHKDARPAAQLAMEIFAKRGPDAFWRAHDELFDKQRSLDEQSLAAIGVTHGLPRPAALAAIREAKHEARIAKDEALAEDLEAQGTPTYFINGRRLVGAQPESSFAAIIDEELKKARAMVSSGTRADRVYDAILASGKKAELSLQIVELPPPGAQSPARGPTGAPVVIQVFSDFQCPFCKRLAPTLDELEKAYPGKIRMVFRHHPLPMHRDARLAAEASMEAFAQGGSPKFWKMHDALFAAQDGGADGLGRQELEEIAAQLGLDKGRFKKALDDGKHRAIVEADSKLATDKGMTGTPSAVVGKYLVGGAQPLGKWKRVVDKVLAEKKTAIAR